MLRITNLIAAFLLVISPLFPDSTPQIKNTSVDWEKGIDFGCCLLKSPLDAGHEFAGSRFIVTENQVLFFDESHCAEPEVVNQCWRQGKSILLPGKFPSVGINRSRVKWRDGKLWIALKNQIFQQDLVTKKWFLEASPNVDFNDFDVDVQGRILLIGTADPKKKQYRALLERVEKDGVNSEIVINYPDKIPQFNNNNTLVLFPKLLAGYESVQIQEFCVLYNSLSRRVFVFRETDGSFKEAKLGLQTRSFSDLQWDGTDPAPKIQDLCWQVLPQGPLRAAIIVPSDAFSSGKIRTQSPNSSTLKFFLISLDLNECDSIDIVPLEDGGFPYFFDAMGKYRPLQQALDGFIKLNKNNDSKINNKITNITTNKKN